MRAFQQQRGLITDGIVGPATYRALREAGWTLGDRMLALLISAPMTGDDVVALQERLSELGYDPGRPGGVFDEQTEHALRRFQRDYGARPRRPVRARHAARRCASSARKVTGGRPHLLREQELLRQAGPRLRGKRIVDRPRSRRPDRGVVSAGVAEADLMWDLARRLDGRMSATGMDAMLSRQEHTCPSEPERAAFANNAGADLVLSLHNDAERSMYAQGLATFHFGNGTGIDVDGRGGARRPTSSASCSSAPRCTTAAPRPAPGSCCGSRGCPPCGSRWATCPTWAICAG